MPNNAPSILTDAAPNPLDYLPFLGRSRSTPAIAPVTDCSFELVVALASKGFVILTGQSGTGKSRAAIELGQALNGLDDYDNGQRGTSFDFVPVGADWTDSRPLIGYINPFGKPRTKPDNTVTNETYEIPLGLRLLIRAAAPTNTAFPMFLILDEMNLSHVERYFSSFLSILEANRSSASATDIQLLPGDRLQLVSEILDQDLPNSPESRAAQELVAQGQGLPVSENFLIVGTVNVDETTYMFSPKVLDRAHVIELSSVPPQEYFGKTTAARKTLPSQKALDLLKWAIEQRREGVLDKHPQDVIGVATSTLNLDATTVAAIDKATQTLLNGAYTLLDPVGFGFGYRVINEVFGYLLCWMKAKTLTVSAPAPVLDGWQEAIDTVFLQKVLPKIHGNRRQLGDSLIALSAFLQGNHEGSNPAAKYRLGETLQVGIAAVNKFDLGVADQMPRSRRKIERMQTQLKATGYTTFIQ